MVAELQVQGVGAKILVLPLCVKLEIERLKITSADLLPKTMLLLMQHLEVEMGIQL